MPQPIQAVTVYCSSSKEVAANYFQAASDLGTAIGRCGWKLVYGGNHIGMMGTLADAARKAGAKVVGITPQLLVDKGIADTSCDELIVTPDLRQRKALMEQRGDAFIALPGGIGTFEEIFEIMAGRFLGYHVKPIVLLNVAGYYDPLLAMLKHGLEQGFIREKLQRVYHVADTVDSAISYLKSHGIAPPPKPSGETSLSALE